MANYDKIIIGGGLYGLYSSLFCGRQGDHVVVLEKELDAFMRATYINQARVHMGYHYPRSLSTGIKSAGYYKRFHKDFGFCIHSSFKQIYATSNQFSWTNAKEFKKFCKDANIFCESIDPNEYFKSSMCDGAFLTEEDTYDALILKKYFMDEIKKYPNITMIFNASIKSINQRTQHYEIQLEDGRKMESDFVLNATYASVNQILNMLGLKLFEIKYELCEIILCHANEKLQNIGITVMDGPFFSIMPFGKTGYHSLTSVTFTPHMTSYESLPWFDCQENNETYCSRVSLGNCNTCSSKPQSAWYYMSNLASKYLKDEYGFEYKHSLFSMKPILKSTEIDDSRPTVIKMFTQNPTFVSVLSGKINTVYDLDEVLKNE